MELGTNQLALQLRCGLIVKISGDKGDRMGKEGQETLLTFVPNVASERATRYRVGKSVNSAVFPLTTTTCATSGRNLGAPRRISSLQRPTAVYVNNRSVY